MMTWLVMLAYNWPLMTLISLTVMGLMKRRTLKREARQQG